MGGQNHCTTTVSGNLGSVTDLGLFTTELETADGIFISLPNSTVWASAIKNFSRNAAEESRIITTPEPQYLVHTLADSSVNLQLRAWVPTPDYWDIYWKTQRKVKERVESKGITIPFPQRDLHIISSNQKE